MDNKVAVLILFFNKLTETVACIESFIPSQQSIYVLNNGSDKKLWNALQEKYSNNRQVVFFHSDTNLGVSVGRNYLIEKTSEPWVLIVDNDIIIKDTQNWINKFYTLLQKNPALQVFTFHIYNVHEGAYTKPVKVVKQERKVSIENTEDELTNCFPGTGSVIHRNVFNKHGLFDATLFVGFEDYEYALRCMNSPSGELKVLHSKEIEMVHDHRFQKRSIDKDAVKERYNEQRIKESYDNIVKKYDIEFEHDWQWWARKQIVDMTGKTIAQKIKYRIAGLARRLKD